MRYCFHTFVLDDERFELSQDDEPIELQPKALSLLTYLIQHRDRTVSKHELLDALWPDATVGEGSLTRAINLARSALGESQREARVIKTVHARGYRIGVPIVEEEEEGGEAPADFVCRERELKAGIDSLEGALGGRGQLLLLAGEPGIGKTRLAEEITRGAANKGAQTYWGRCYEGEGVPSYWPWIQIFRSYIRDCEPGALLTDLGRGAEPFAAIVPELREQLPELELDGSQPESPFRFFDAVAQLITAGARERPLVLVLDDLHQADQPSLLLLQFLARELSAAPLLMIVTYRDSALSPDHPLQQTLGALTGCARRTLTLQGLGPDCVDRFMAHAGLTIDRRLAAAVYRRTEGNPLFVRELVQWIESLPADRATPDELEIPEGVRLVIRSRLGALPADCARVLGVGAVIGRDFSLIPVARVAELSETTVLEQLTVAERARIIAPVRGPGGQFRFSHPLIRATLYDELGSDVRVHLHRAVGEALEELYRPRPIVPTHAEVPIESSRLAELAHHFCEAALAGDVEKAIDYAVRAGDHARSVQALADAARHYERALDILERLAPDQRRDEVRSRLESVRD